MQLLGKKIKVFVSGNDNVGWSIDNDKKNAIALFKDSSDFKVTRNILSADMIYSVWYDSLRKPYIIYPLLLLKKLKKIKIFSVITNNIENTPEKIIQLGNLIDVWVSPSLKTLDFMKKNKVHAIHIPFLIKNNIFTDLKRSKEEILEIFKIDFKQLRGKILIGSFQRDSLGSDLSRPKWQKNPDFLIDILKEIPNDKFVLILAGPRRHYIINRCKNLNIPYIFIGDENYINNNEDDILKNNLSLEKINLLYNLVDMYIVTSKSEGGPKAVLESALTKTLIFSTDVGLASDVLQKNLIFSENNKEKIKSAIFSLLSDANSFNNEIDYNFKSVSDILNKKNVLEKIKNSYEN